MNTATKRIDLTAQSPEALNQIFEIRVEDTEVIFREKSVAGEKSPARSLPKFLFKEDVLKELEKNP